MKPFGWAEWGPWNLKMPIMLRILEFCNYLTVRRWAFLQFSIKISDCWYWTGLSKLSSKKFRRHQMAAKEQQFCITLLPSSDCLVFCSLCLVALLLLYWITSLFLLKNNVLRNNELVRFGGHPLVITSTLSIQMSYHCFSECATKASLMELKIPTEENIL